MGVTLENIGFGHRPAADLFDFRELYADTTSEGRSNSNVKIFKICKIQDGVRPPYWTSLYDHISV